MLYFIAADDGPIKIGYCNWNIWGRLRSLQHQHYRELKLLGVMDGDHQAELALHARFADDRIRHEWFHPSPELLGFIEREAGWPAALANPWSQYPKLVEKLEVEKRAHQRALEQSSTI